MKLFAEVNKDDNGWKVYACPPKDMYVPREIELKRNVVETESKSEQVTAKEAREKGYELEDTIPDDEIVNVVVETSKTSEKKWTEIRLDFNGVYVDGNQLPKRCKRHKVRQEIAVALESPFSYLQDMELVEIVKKTIESWKDCDMGTMVPQPVALVHLGVKELDGEEEVYTRDIFLIKSYSYPTMLLDDGMGNEYTLELRLGVLENCYISNLIMFMPSNVVISEA